MPRTSLILVFAACLVAAASAPVTAGENQSGQISVRNVDEGRWEFSYRHPQGVNSLRFLWPTHFLREELWFIKSSGYELRRDGDSQVLTLKENYPASAEVVIWMDVDTRFIPRGYDFFNEFTDGGIAIFLGNLYATTIADDTLFSNVTVEPPDGHRVVIDGSVFDGSGHWEDPEARGTYAYIGPQLPVEATAATLIVDDGLPEWLKESAAQRLTRLLGAFTDRTGVAPVQPPFVLWSYEPTGYSAYAFNGGTRDNLIQLRLQGAGWSTRNDEAERRLMRFLAHEIAHIWNGQLSRPRAGLAPWIHEGSADALADLVLLGLGVTEPEEFYRSLELALNDCHESLRARQPLSDMPHTRLHYTCGHVVSYWAHRALQAAGHQDGLFTFWGQMIGVSSAVPDGYTEADYFSVLSDLGVPDESVAVMSAFVSSQQESPAEVISSAIEVHGLAVYRSDEAAPRSANIRAAGAALMAMLELDCGDNYGFYTHDAGLELGGLAGCNSVTEGFLVTHFGDVPLDAANFGAYRFAKQHCGTAETLQVGSSEQMIEMRCPTGLPEPVGWWAVSVRGN